MINKNLTKKQTEVLNLFSRITKERGQPPTIRELSEACDTSASSAHRMVRVLCDKGYMKKGNGQSWYNYQIAK